MFLILKFLKFILINLKCNKYKTENMKLYKNNISLYLNELSILVIHYQNNIEINQNHQETLRLSINNKKIVTLYIILTKQSNISDLK